VVWDLNKIYPSNLRGEQCTSADAAGFPIAPLLFTADEIAAGSIDHAIRYTNCIPSLIHTLQPQLLISISTHHPSISMLYSFILPNARMRKSTYVHPGSHAGAPSALGTAPIYGTRFRMKASQSITHLSAGAQVIYKHYIQISSF
jgi:hypothetical protein